MWRSIKNKILLGVLLVVGLTLALDSTYSIQRQRELILNTLRAVGSGLVRSLQLPALQALVTGDLTQLQPLLEELERDGDVKAVRIVDVRFMCLASTQTGELGKQLKTPEIEHAFRSNRLETSEGSGDAVDFFQPISGGGRNYGMIWLRLPLMRTRGEIDRHTQDTLLAALASLIAAFIVSFVITRNILGPIQQLMTAAEAVGREDYNFEINIPNRDELGVLATTFNRMTTNLRATLQGIRMHAQRLEEARSSLASRVHELEVLNTISLLFMTNYTRTPLADLLKRILELLGESLGARRLSLILVEPDGKLLIKVAMGMGPDGEIVENVKLETGGSIIDYVLKTGVSLLVADINNDPRFLRPAGGKYSAASFMSIPMLLGQSVMGIINATEKAANTHFTTDDQRYVEVMASQIASIIDIHRKTSQLLTQERVENELRIARRIQARVLPDLHQKRGVFAVAARSVPATEVGGDYFDLLPGTGDAVTLTIGDISGKGIPAAMVMVALYGMMRGLAMQQRSPSETMVIANRQMNEKAQEMSMYASLVVAVLDTRLGVFRYCGGGHPYPILLRAGSNSPEFLTEGGILIGLGEELDYTEGEVKLEPGDTLLLFSDGATDAVNMAGDDFGAAALLESFRRHRDKQPSELMAAVYADIERFRGDAPPKDDITLMVVQAVGDNNPVLA